MKQLVTVLTAAVMTVQGQGQVRTDEIISAAATNGTAADAAERREEKRGGVSSSVRPSVRESHLKPGKGRV